MRKNLILWMGVVMLLLVGCSSDDDATFGSGGSGGSDPVANSPRALYAIVKLEEAQLIDIIPSDYAMTLDNIIAVNPETGEFKMKDTEKIESKAYPFPTQYVIQFYSGESFLFEAKLNSSLSSYLPKGLTFCHMFTDKNGQSLYNLEAVRFSYQDGRVEGNTTEQQEWGMKRMYEILQKAGKVTTKIEYDFQF